MTLNLALLDAQTRQARLEAIELGGNVLGQFAAGNEFDEQMVVAFGENADFSELRFRRVVCHSHRDPEPAIASKKQHRERTDRLEGIPDSSYRAPPSLKCWIGL